MNSRTGASGGSIPLRFGLREDGLRRLPLALGEQTRRRTPLPLQVGSLEKCQGLTGRKSWSGKGEFAGVWTTMKARSVA